jgi:hypothetical protein
MGYFKITISSFLFLFSLLLATGQDTLKLDSLGKKLQDSALKVDSIYMNPKFLPYWFSYTLQWTPHHRTNYYGSVYQLLSLPERIKETSLSYFSLLNEFSAYTWSKNSDSLIYAIRTLSCKGPFSVASYAQGTKREQHFDFLFHFPWGKQVNILLNYNLLGSPGSYKNQKIALSNFFANVEASSKNNKVHLKVLFSHQYYRFQENGGITSTSKFLDTTLYDRALTPVQLSKAEQHFRKTTFSFNPRVRLISNRTFELHIFPLILEYEKKSRVYMDAYPTSGYYPFIYLDSSHTYDSISLIQTSLKNNLVIRMRSLILNAGFDHSWEYARSMFSIDSSSSLAHLIWNYRSSLLDWKGETKKGMAGSAKNLFYFQHIFSIHFSQKNTIFLIQSFVKNSPSLLYKHYRGNHIQYNENLPSYFYLIHELGYASPWFSISGYYVELNHFPLWGYTHFISIEKAKSMGVKSTLDFERPHWGQTLRIDFQHSYSPWIHLPDISIIGESYYRNKFFHKKLRVDVGLRYFYYSSYKADAYYPPLAIFYPQWDVKTDGFIYPTFFVRVQIKRAILFVETYNFTAGLLPVDYWEIPGYPLPDRGIRWGVSWMFLN